MRYKLLVLSSLTSLGLLLGLAVGAPAQIAHDDMTALQTDEFRRIDQPLWTKALVTGGGAWSDWMGTLVVPVQPA